MTATNNVMYETNKTNISLFMTEANKLADSKIMLNKSLIKSTSVIDNFNTMAQQCLGKDYNFLCDTASVRLYIKDVFGVKVLRIFENVQGELTIDIEHMLVFLNYLKAHDNKNIQVALGLLYYVAGQTLSGEFTKLSSVSSGNKITPIFEYNPSLFRWKRCNFILRKYMLALSLPTSDKGYYYEMPNANQIAYLMTKGYSLQDAKAYMQSTSCGIFMTYLDKDLENMIMPAILSGDITSYAMDGYFKQSIIEDFNSFSVELQSNAIFNVYTRNVKPILIDLMGVITDAILKDAKNGSMGEAEVYHISPLRVGVKIPMVEDVNQVFPSMSVHLKEVKTLDYFDVLSGEHLY